MERWSRQHGPLVLGPFDLYLFVLVRFLLFCIFALPCPPLKVRSYGIELSLLPKQLIVRNSLFDCVSIVCCVYTFGNWPWFTISKHFLNVLPV